MTAMFQQLLSALGTAIPSAAMKVVEAPASQALPYVPHSYWPWIVFGGLLLMLYYVFDS